MTKDTSGELPSEEILAKGKEVSGATFAALSGSLMKALEEDGVAGAVTYCNLAAHPLVDSLSRVHQADIRRTSLKVRNENNAPTSEEKSVLEEYSRSIQSGETLQPIVRQTDPQAIAYYAPIMTNALCLQCHGTVGETMREEDYAVIRELYPDDHATGYAVGDLRGIWSIRFQK